MSVPAFWAITVVIVLAYGGLLFWTWPDRPKRMRASGGERPSEAESPTDYIPINEAGRWFYANASQELRDWLNDMSRRLDSTLTEHAASYYTTSWQDGRCDLYGRWEPGLPMEKIDGKDGDFTAFSAVFGSDKRPILDMAVLRRDLQPVLSYYEDAANPWLTPEQARAKFVPAEQAKIDAAIATWTPLSDSGEEARLAFAAAPEDDALRDEFQERSTAANIAYHEVEKARRIAALELIKQLRDGRLVAKGIERVNRRAEDEKTIRTMYWNFLSLNLEEAEAGGQGHTYLVVRIRAA